MNHLNNFLILILAVILFPASACTTAAKHGQDLHDTQDREMTIGIVQKEIRRGMSQAEVAAALGSPNIVTKDGDGKESWIYDKIATSASSSHSEVYGTILILGFSKGAGAASTTQKTLTVVIKFDPESRVDSFTYHSSKF